MAHKRERLSIPQVAIVYSAHKDICEDDPYVLVDLEPDGIVETLGADEIPVERPGEETHPLIITGASKDVTEDCAAIIGKAEDGYARE